MQLGSGCYEKPVNLLIASAGKHINIWDPLEFCNNMKISGFNFHSTFSVKFLDLESASLSTLGIYDADSQIDL